MFTIVGLIVAVAAALLLLVAVLQAGSSGMQNSKASNAAAELAQLELGVQGLYSAQSSFSSLSNTVALDAGTSVVPSSMIDGSNIINEWGGAVDLAVASDTSEFTITENSVPESACAVLATKATNPLSVTVNGTALSTPIDVGAVAKACAANGSDNTLVFTFGH